MWCLISLSFWPLIPNTVTLMVLCVEVVLLESAFFFFQLKYCCSLWVYLECLIDHFFLIHHLVLYFCPPSSSCTIFGISTLSQQHGQWNPWLYHFPFPHKYIQTAFSTHFFPYFLCSATPCPATDRFQSALWQGNFCSCPPYKTLVLHPWDLDQESVRMWMLLHSGKFSYSWWTFPVYTCFPQIPHHC